MPFIYSSFIIPSFHSLKAFWECSSHKNTIYEVFVLQLGKCNGSGITFTDHIKCYIIQLQTKYQILLRIGLDHIWRQNILVETQFHKELAGFSAVPRPFALVSLYLNATQSPSRNGMLALKNTLFLSTSLLAKGF